MRRSVDPQRISEALNALGAALAEAGGGANDLVVVGGWALASQGLVKRLTADVDVVGTVANGSVGRLGSAAVALAKLVEEVGDLMGLQTDWLNTGPESLLDFGLPEGFVERLHRRDFGPLRIWVASRLDLICLKVFAATDQPGSRHHRDLQEMAPTAPELDFAAAWARTQDSSPGFAAELERVLTQLAGS